MGTLLDAVKRKVKDTSGILSDPDDYRDAIATALETYSKHRPLRGVYDIAGTGNRDYPVPAAWVNGFSLIKAVEYPIAVPAVLLDEDEDWVLYQAPDGWKIRFINAVPSPSETFRVAITLTRSEADILPGDASAVENLSVSYCLEMLANAMSQTADPTIQADAVNYRSKSGEFAARARRYMQLYRDHMGIREEGEVPAATVVVSTAEKYPGGAERLTHTRWARDKR